MIRRRFLVALSATLPIAGCLSGRKQPEEAADPDDSTSNGTDTDDSTTNGTDTDNSTSNGTDTDDSDTGTDNSDTDWCTGGESDSYETFSIGETTGDVNPHGLTLRNDGDDSRTIGLCITDAETAETLVDQSCSLGGGEAMSGELRGPAAYEVQVSVPDSGAEHTTTVEYFDTCNDYGTTVTITSSGTITSETVRTDAECAPE